MTFVSYAQNFEDVLLWRALRHVPAGFYIDVGASHPDIDTVTRAFYDRGWRGINVEPTAAMHQRLVAARPRDVNLRLALGREAGTTTFFAVGTSNTGLSTLDRDAVARYAEQGIGVEETVVGTDTLAAVCRAHAGGDIHFLKVDVEGAERLVLEGADFAAFRPWIVLAEATAPMSTVETHADWEPILLEAGYRFVWFDGLNRFYVAAERFEALAPHFRTPPNVFDDFLRAADTEWARRVDQAESRLDAVMQRALAAEQRASLAEDRAELAHLRLAYSSVEGARTAELAETHTAVMMEMESRAAHAAAEMRHAVAVAEDAMHRADSATAWLGALQNSTSWRVTRPLRRVLGLRARLGGAAVADAPILVSRAEPVAGHMDVPLQASVLGGAPGGFPGRTRAAVRGAVPRLAVHQFHSGTAVGDAITNAMLLTRRVLRGLGYDSRIFAEHVDPALCDDIHTKDAMPEHDRYVLILRHSMGHDALEQVLGLQAPKVLMYHNITPPELLAGSAFLQNYARLGRRQLEVIRPAVVAALADSEYNAMELRRLGFDRVAACTLLFDLGERGVAVSARPVRAMAATGLPALFTVLFVGRITASKGQLALVAGFARFKSGYAGATQLVLVGRQDDAAATNELLSLVRRLGLDHGAVDVTGLVSDEALEQRYAAADLYVSASQHEGFGVPLIEAVARGVPVLAVGAGAVPYTLGAPAANPAGLLADTTPTGIAAGMMALALDPAARAALAESQRASMQRFTLARQLPALVDAVVEAGAARPVDRAARAALVANARFTVAGHVNGTYSLAEINRSLALALEAARPGTVRLLAVEGAVTTHVGHVPAGQREAVGALLARPAPITGPAIVISQHYPVWVPPVSPELGDVPLALFFWEESLVPAATVAVLNAGFRGVLAPTRMVARALVDSGVDVPVRVVGHVPRLGAYHELGARRAGRMAEVPFTVLHVSSCFPRKGVDVLLAAWARAFEAGDGVRLVIKGFPNPTTLWHPTLSRCGRHTRAWRTSC